MKNRTDFFNSDIMMDLSKDMYYINTTYMGTFFRPAVWEIALKVSFKSDS